MSIKPSLSAPTAEIHLAALDHNFSRVKALAPQSKVLAVLKANGYGHGLVAIAKQLGQADAFGVARIEEALALRTGGIVKPIVLLEGFFAKTDLPILVANNFQTVIHLDQQIDDLLAVNLDAPLKVWLKVDTGMNRLGISMAHFTACYSRLAESANVQQPLRVMTHFACADDVNDDMTTSQMALFNQLLDQLLEKGDVETTLANSAAIINWPQSRTHWVRPGLMLYGVSPVIGVVAEQLQLEPVMTLKSSLIAVKLVKQGQSVGYGATWVAPEDTYIGVVAIGYGDGYPRHAPTGTPVLVNGRQVPLVGRVSMDMITINLGVKTDAQVGDEVILWGVGLPIEHIANLATTIPYELLCNITQRVLYRYV